ncbi:hypothetical protein HMPREF0542_11033 [Ligilactobacillus ruminis ATCC 25644]|uniref:Uncharacterized protein n=1 Tax=Ligilactobacillus ruminis ATCC 25644 TaxID=525362 RepID=E7FQ56_9LACO|nr:hypothetical protein HMPREF0542_11033 [Ligilactobacillus ruminis ATCC 25644]
MIFDKKRRVAVSGRALFCVFAGWLNAVLAEAKADKNRAKCLNFVYRPNEDRAHGDKSRQKPSKMLEFCLPTRPKSVRAEAKADKNRSKCLNLVYRADRNRRTQRQK